MIGSFGGADRFAPAELRPAAPGPGEVRVEVAAASVNPVDLATRLGTIIPQAAARFPMILGWDAAGTVVEVGPDVTAWRDGDRVALLTVQPVDQNGTYAEHVNVDAGLLARVPDGVSLELAATVPLAALTAGQMLEWADVPVGGTLLVDPLMGAVGRFAVQLARRDAIAVVAVARPEDRAAALALGAAQVVERGDFTTAVRRLHPEGVDAAIDLVDGGAARAAMAAVRDGGSYITAIPPFQDDTGPFASERGIRVEIQGVRPDPTGLARLLESVDRGDLSTGIAVRYPLTQAAAAHRRQAKGGLRGKLNLLP